MRTQMMPRHFKMVLLSMFLAVGVALGIVESIYLPPLPIPGAKLGLANLVSLILIMYFPLKDVMMNVVLRVVLVSILTGTFMTSIFFFSLGGAVVAVLVMWGVYTLFSGPLTMIGVSALGAVAHNLTQLGIAVWFLGSWGLLFHMPFLVLTGVVTGVFIGHLANIIRARQDIRPLLAGDG